MQKPKQEFKPGEQSKYALKTNRMYGGKGPNSCCAHRITDDQLRRNRVEVRKSGHLEGPLGSFAFGASWRWSKPDAIGLVNRIMDSTPKGRTLISLDPAQWRQRHAA